MTAVLLFLLALGAEDPTFERDVRPILAKRCLTCHSGSQPRGGLDVTNVAGIRAGGAAGPAAVAGKGDESPLYTLAAHLDSPRMPPNGSKTPQRELDILRRWIDAGMPESAGSPNPVSPPPPAAGSGPVPQAALARPTPVTALAAGPQLAVAGRRQVLLFDPATLQPQGAWPFPEGEIHALRFAGGGKVLLAAGGVGGKSGALVGFSLPDGKRIFTWAGGADAVLAADLTPDLATIVMGGPSRTAKAVRVADGKVLHEFRKPTDWVLAVAVSPDGLLTAVGDRFGGLWAIETGSGREFAVLRGHSKAVTALAWQPDGDRLFSASDDGTARVWDLHAKAEVRRWTAHASGIAAAALDGGRLVTAGRDRMVRVWNEAGQRQAEFGPLADEATEAAAGAGRTFSGDWSGSVRAWPNGQGAPVPIAPLTAAAAIPVPLEVAALAPVTPLPQAKAKASGTAGSEAVARKRQVLRAVEEAAERLKDEAARNPADAGLAKAYLLVCEAALAAKADLLAAEAAGKDK